MRLKRKNITYLLGVFTICAAIACSKNEASTNPDLPVSRLLISNAISDSISNGISIFNPADVSPLVNEGAYNMQNPLPTGITYDQNDNRGFQLGMLTKTIKSFSINTDGTLRLLNAFTDTLITDGKAVAYNYLNKNLYLTNQSDSTLRVYGGANTTIGSARPRYSFKLTAKPSGVFYAERNLLLVMGEDRKVQVLNNIASLDSAELSSEAMISDAILLSGIWYAAGRDILFLTDMGDESDNSDGAVLIIEGAAAKLAAGGTLVADRKIMGTNTLLGNPVAIAFDDRQGKDIIYVAEKANKKVLAFRLSDEGNASPFISKDRNVAPESIWLDAR